MTDRYGDPFRAFYDRALPAVYGYLRTRLADLSRVEDVTQEVFMAAVKQWPFPANVRDEVAFVMGIARHKLVDEYRRQDAQVRRRQQYASMSGHAAAHRTTAADEVRVHWATESLLSRGTKALRKSFRQVEKTDV